MKLRNYALSLAEQVKQQTNRLHGTVRMAAISGMTTAMIAVPTMVTYASDPTTGGGTNLLSADIMQVLTDGFSSVAITFTAIIAIGVVTGITIAGMSAGSKYAVKYIKGLLSQAA